MALLFALLISVASAGWQTGQLFVRDDNSKGPTAIYINTQGMDPRWPYPPFVWNTIDVTTIPSGEIPADAKSLFLHGTMIITHGNAAVDCSMYFVFRVPGDTIPHEAYSSVMVVPSSVGGLRQLDALWVPVKNGRVEFYWYRGTQGTWPDNCSYGINLNVQGFLR